MRRRVVTRADGSVAVIIPAQDARRPDEPDDEFYERVFTETMARQPDWAGCAHVDIATDAQPSRRFRNAWHVDGDVLTVNMTKARPLRLEEIRAERNARLKASDGDVLREQEQKGPKLVKLTSYRQSLRDLPQVVGPALDALATPEDLDAFQPPWPEKP